MNAIHALSQLSYRPTENALSTHRLNAASRDRLLFSPAHLAGEFSGLEVPVRTGHRVAATFGRLLLPFIGVAMKLDSNSVAHYTKGIAGSSTASRPGVFQVDPAGVAP